MKTKLFLPAIISQILGIHALIVPDITQEVLLLFFSTIPQLKKGTDSRLGWRFRLGRHADAQVLIELGPQKYTQPLANQEDENTNNKRNAIKSQKYKEKQQNDDSEGGKRFKTWRENVQERRKASEERT